MRSFHAATLVACAFAPVPAAQDWPADRKRGAESIRAEPLEAWLTELTSEKMLGRATGEPGFALAADFVRDHFRRLKLEPLGDDYFQRVPWTRLSIDPEQSYVRLVRTSDDGTDVELATMRVGAGMHASSSVDSTHEGDLALTEFDGDLAAIEKKELDSCNVIVVSSERIEKLRTYYRLSRAIRKAGGRLIAVAAPGLTELVNPAPLTIPGGSDDRIAKSRLTRPRVCALDADALDAALKAAGGSLDAVRKSDNALRVPGVRAISRIRMREEPAPAFNVGAVLRGSDPNYRDEYVLIGSHLDHLGRKGDTFCPGADDDGSGTVGVLALASAFVANGAPRRSVAFVTFCGEERGLIGSAYFAKHSPIPLESIVAELQLDMIGRSEEHPGEPAARNRNCLHLIGTQKLSDEFHALCLRLNKARTKFDLEWDEEDVFYRSDHWNFAREGVPAAFFFTGFHKDYHQPGDTVDKIEFPKLVRVVRYVYDIAYELAADDSRPHVSMPKWRKLRKKGRREPVAPIRN